MNITKVAAWSEIVSSVAILATLAYLAVQVQQNTAAISAQSRQAIIEGDLQILTNVINQPEIFLDFAGESELSPERKMRMHAALLTLMRSRESHWFEYQSGVLEKSAWLSYRNALINVLGTERTRNWWTTIGSSAVDASFVDEVNKLIDGKPYSNNWERVLALK